MKDTEAAIEAIVKQLSYDPFQPTYAREQLRSLVKLALLEKEIEQLSQRIGETA